MIRATVAAARAKKAAAASDQLTRRLLDLARAGQRPPCAADDRWLSEDQDERAEAASLCAGCPVITECRDAAAAQRESFGVWGAVGRSPPKCDQQAA